MRKKSYIWFAAFITLSLAAVVTAYASDIRESFYISRMEDRQLSPRQRIVYMDSLILLQPDNVEVRKIKSDLCFNIGDYTEAAKEYLELAGRLSDRLSEENRMRAMKMAAISMWHNNRFMDASKMALNLLRVPKSDSIRRYDLDAMEIVISTALASRDLKTAGEYLDMERAEIRRLGENGLLSKDLERKYQATLISNQTELSIHERNYSRAMKEAREAMQLASGTRDTVEVNILLAEVYARIGEDKAAMELYRHNIPLVPSIYNRRLYSNEYAELLLRNGKANDALAVIKPFGGAGQFDAIESKRLKIKGNAMKYNGDMVNAFESLGKAAMIDDSLQRSGESLSYALREFENGIAQDEMERLTRRGDRWRTATFSIIGGVLLCVLAAILTVVIIRKRKSRIVNQETAADSDESRQLVSAALKMSRISDTIKTIGELASDRSPDALDKISTELKQLDYSENTWEMFRKSFESMHPGFMAALDKDYPGLSINEQRMAAYIVLGLTNKEIASMINRQPRTVETIKYRLRKSLKIPTDVTTIDFLRRYLPIR